HLGPGAQPHGLGDRFDHRVGGDLDMKRTWMVLAATAALAVAAGCGGGSSDNGGGGGGGVKPVSKIGPTEGALNLIAWQGYTEPKVVKPVKAQTRCKVECTY